VIAEFIDRYNRQWLIERLGYRTPAEARAEGGAPRREDSADPSRRRGPEKPQDRF